MTAEAALASSASQPQRPFVSPVRSTRTFESAIDHIIEGIERARLRQGDRLPRGIAIGWRMVGGSDR